MVTANCEIVYWQLKPTLGKSKVPIHQRMGMDV
jgi:hypothetical protein